MKQKSDSHSPRGTQTQPRAISSRENLGPLRILSVGAHPADIFDQSGGTMAHHVARGDWVGCCVLTHGARVHDKIIADGMYRRRKVPAGGQLKELMARRADVKATEVRKACARLGVRHIYFFGADDAVLLPNQRDVRRLARLLRELKPDIILTHYPLEHGGIWNSHASTGQIVLLAVGLAGSVDPGDRNPPHHTAQVFFWGQGAGRLPSLVFDGNRGFYNNVFVDITDVIEKKLACLDELVSQGYGGAYARKRIETGDGAFGGAVRVPYAEGYISHEAELYQYLPLSEMKRRIARESDHEMMARYSYKLKT